VLGVKCNELQFNARYDDHGSCGEGLEWWLEEDVLTINGTGAIPDYADYFDPPWYSISYLVKSLVIAEGVTSVGDNAFKAFNVNDLSLPESLKSIGEDAFYGSNRLTSLKLPKNLESIGSFAFGDCYQITSVTIPASVKEFDPTAFPAASSYIVEEGNTNYKSVDGVLFNHDLTTFVRIPGKIISYTIPESVRIIGERAFYHSTVQNVVLPSQLEVIEKEAFLYSNSLSNLTIPASVKSIGSGAVYGQSLESLKIEEGNTNFVMIDGFLFDHDVTRLIQYTVHDQRQSYTVPSTVTIIDSYAFSCSYSLRNVTLPDSVTTIGDSAFYYCSQMENVNMPADLETIGDNAFNSCGKLKSLRIPGKTKSIGSHAFEWCESLIDVSIPDSVTSIGEYAFYRCPMKNVTIPKGLRRIETYTFFTCNGLVDLVIPDSVEYIGPYAISYCEELKTLLIPDTVKTITNNAFCYCNKLETVYYQGSLNLSDTGLFYSDVKNVCVSPDYAFSKLGDKNVTNDSTVCQEFQSQFNHCFKATYDVESGTLKQEKKKDAIEWESRTNGCAEYQCDNENGKMSWSLCNNSICLAGKCEDKDKLEEKGWVVEMEIDPIEVVKVVVEDIAKDIDRLTGVGEGNVKVGVETDSKGNIVRVLAYIDNYDTAKVVADAVDGLDKGEGCDYGVLCRVTSVHLRRLGWQSLSSGNINEVKGIMIFAMFFLSLILSIVF